MKTIEFIARFEAITQSAVDAGLTITSPDAKKALSEAHAKISACGILEMLKGSAPNEGILADVEQALVEADRAVSLQILAEGK